MARGTNEAAAAVSVAGVEHGGRNGASLRFELRCKLAAANSLRRAVLAEVPTVAAKYDPYDVDNPAANDVRILKNTTVLHDQIMGHRVSLLPVHLSAKEVAAHERDRFKFVINKRNEGSEPMWVTTADIQVLDGSSGEELGARVGARLFPPDPVTGDHPIIARLKPHGDTFHCEFYARRGIGLDHARWCAVSTCAFANVVDEAAAAEALRTALAGAKDPAEAAAVEEQHRAIERFRHFVRDERGDACRFAFHVESECGMRAADIVLTALDVLVAKAAALPGKMAVVSEHGDAPGLFLIELHDEDHTMGNLFQALAFDAHVVPDAAELDYVGYYVPHPLERKVVLKVLMRDGAAVEDAAERKAAVEALVAKCASSVEAYLEEMRGALVAALVG